MVNKEKKDSIVKPYEDAEHLNAQTRQQHVLIIDDQSTGRVILENVIQQISDTLSITALSHPLEALNWLDNHHPDLIITDYRMPEMNGVEFIKAVRQKAPCHNIPIMMITVVSEKEVRYEALDAGVTAFLTRPIDQIECRTSCRNLLQMYEQHLIIQDRADWLARQVKITTEQIIAREKEAILQLAKAGEYRDEETGNHVIRMAKYSRLIAEELGSFTEQECEDLEYAAPMHDIGKIGIPDDVLLKPGKLNAAESRVMERHTTIGHSILSGSQSKYMQIGAIIALNHHERIDGLGYPNGLKGDYIPLIARIVTVADVYDALISIRPYKAAWPIADAVNYITQQAGTHFDENCVRAFLARLDDIKKIQRDYADDPNYSLE